MHKRNMQRIYSKGRRELNMGARGQSSGRSKYYGTTDADEGKRKRKQNEPNRITNNKSKKYQIKQG